MTRTDSDNLVAEGRGSSATLLPAEPLRPPRDTAADRRLQTMFEIARILATEHDPEVTAPRLLAVAPSRSRKLPSAC